MKIVSLLRTALIFGGTTLFVPSVVSCALITSESSDEVEFYAEKLNESIALIEKSELITTLSNVDASSIPTNKGEVNINSLGIDNVLNELEPSFGKSAVVLGTNDISGTMRVAITISDHVDYQSRSINVTISGFKQNDEYVVNAMNNLKSSIKTNDSTLHNSYFTVDEKYTSAQLGIDSKFASNSNIEILFKYKGTSTKVSELRFDVHINALNVDSPSYGDEKIITNKIITGFSDKQFNLVSELITHANTYMSKYTITANRNAKFDDVIINNEYWLSQMAYENIFYGVSTLGTTIKLIAKSKDDEYGIIDFEMVISANSGYTKKTNIRIINFISNRATINKERDRLAAPTLTLTSSYAQENFIIGQSYTTTELDINVGSVNYYLRYSYTISKLNQYENWIEIIIGIWHVDEPDGYKENVTKRVTMHSIDTFFAPEIERLSLLSGSPVTGTAATMTAEQFANSNITHSTVREIFDNNSYVYDIWFDEIVSFDPVNMTVTLKLEIRSWAGGYWSGPRAKHLDVILTGFAKERK